MKDLKKIYRCQKRVRAKLKGTASRPRLSVYRSSRYISAQLIDDERQRTIIGLHEKSLKLPEKLSKTEKAQKLGEVVAKKAKETGIKAVVFDRGPYRYHGRVKAFAEAARKSGLKF